jgi:hypothetical protein
MKTVFIISALLAMVIAAPAAAPNPKAIPDSKPVLLTKRQCEWVDGRYCCQYPDEYFCSG